MIKIHKAVKAIIQKERKYLILESTYGKDKIRYYDLVGGRIHSGENEIEALIREVSEEIGADIEVGEYIGEWSFERIDNTIVSCKTYKCSIINGKIDISKNPSKDEDINGIIWLTKEELLKSKLFQGTSIYSIFKKLT